MTKKTRKNSKELEINRALKDLQGTIRTFNALIRRHCIVVENSERWASEMDKWLDALSRKRAIWEKDLNVTLGAKLDKVLAEIEQIPRLRPNAEPVHIGPHAS